MIASWQETDDKPRQYVEKQRNYSADGLPSGHVRLWELDCKEVRMPKNWCLWTVVLEKTLESPLDSKEIKPVNSKENQPWIFIGRTDDEAEALILWPPDAKSGLTEETPMLEKIESKRRRGQQRMRCLDSITNSMDMSLSKPREIVKDKKAWHAAVHAVTKSQTRISNWTTIPEPMEPRHTWYYTQRNSSGAKRHFNL